jgi:hypothetical protein
MWNDGVGTACVRHRRRRRQRHFGTFCVIDGKSSHQFVGHGCQVQAVVPVSGIVVSIEAPSGRCPSSRRCAYGQGGGGDIARNVAGRISGGGPSNSQGGRAIILVPRICAIAANDDYDDVNARAMFDDVAMEEDGMTTTTLTRSHLPMGVYVV